MKPEEIEIQAISKAIKRLVRIHGYSFYDIEDTMAQILNEIKK